MAGSVKSRRDDIKGPGCNYKAITSKGRAGVEILSGFQAGSSCRRKDWATNEAFDANEAEIIKEAYGRYKFGTRMFESIIRKVYKVRISHSRTCICLLAAEAGREPDQQKRRKWVGTIRAKAQYVSSAY